MAITATAEMIEVRMMIEMKEWFDNWKRRKRMVGHTVDLLYINFPHRDSLGCMQHDAVQSGEFDGFCTKWSGGWWPWPP
jgi:urocanate hydratase